MKVAIVVNDTFSAWIFRKGLIRALVAHPGYQVTVVAPSDEKYSELLRGIGARHHAVRMERFFSPLTDVRTCVELFRFFRRERPDVVHTFTIKPNLYGVLMARLAGVRTLFCSATGLGQLYSADAPRSFRMVRALTNAIFWGVCRICTRFSFQNADDMNRFIEAGILPRHKALLIRGSGIDLEEYSEASGDADRARREMQVDADARVVLMVTRAIWNKGVREFVEASKIAARQDPSVRFVLLGSVETGPEAVPQKYLESQASEHFRWLGFRHDVRDYVAAADVVVLPSYYQEGIPRCLLEGMAMGKAIITTDSVGCREVVDPGRNGYLVPIKDAAALAQAVVEAVGERARLAAFGRQSRLKVEQEFSEAMVIRRSLAEFYGIV